MATTSLGHTPIHPPKRTKVLKGSCGHNFGMPCLIATKLWELNPTIVTYNFMSFHEHVMPEP